MHPDWKHEAIGSGYTKERKFRVGWLLLVTFVLALLFLFHPFGLVDRSLERLSDSPKDVPLEQCRSPLPPKATPPSVNIWASLTVSETAQIQSWLEDPERNLNLTRNPAAAISDNSIFLIEAYYPSKADATRYLTSPTSVPPPTRYARVTIHHGAQINPVVRNYLLGPLPIGPSTQMRNLTEIYHRPEIPYDARGFAYMQELDQVLALITSSDLDETLIDLFGGSVRNNTLVAGSSAPFSFDGSFRRVWLSYRRNVPGPWLSPVNFFQYVDITGTDSSQWKILKTVYNHQIFSSTDEFIEAYRNGTLVRLPHRPDQTEDASWTTRKRVGAQRDLDHLPGPRSVSFAGLRFRVDKARQYVSWMGWGLFLGFDRDMGLSLWDIRLKGDRIIYQLAPQEAIAQYSGNDPTQATTVWMDRYFGMGTAVREMMPGYDCPHEAVYLPAMTYTSYGMIVNERAVCIFEQDTGRPLTRHTGFMEGEFGAVKGYVLTIRSISTVGNYDYLFDYIFHLDGTIEVRLSASGYLQGGYWEPKQSGYGAKIRDTTMGNLHDHAINYKIDFDIAGTRNSLLETTTRQEEVTQPWFDEDWGSTVIQQKITKRIVQNESEALLKYPPNFQGGYAIVNQEETNRWGHPRGYAIHPGYSPVHATVVGSKRMLNNANWARYNLAVSRRKDNEPSSSSMWNMNLPGAPTVDFHEFFDGENITQEDLVAWVNVGTHHLPQAEDSPNTKTTVATSSFVLTPLNYFDSDIAMDSTNAILLNIPANPRDTYTFNDYGVKQHFTCIPKIPAPFEYTPGEVYDYDGHLDPPSSVEEARRRTELYHRIRIEL